MGVTQDGGELSSIVPYVVLDQGQPNLIDPLTDGRYVIGQVWSVSLLP